MPENSADPPLRCSFAASGSGSEESQPLGPDLLLSRAPAHARGPRGRFAKGHSGNPQGRPPGIPNPRRRVIDLRARPPAPGALSKLVERKPWLLRPILAQLLPPARAIDPAGRLGISIRSLHDAAEFQRALQTVCAAVSAGEIGIREAGHIARQVRTRMRALRPLARLRRRALRLANKANPLRPPLG
jgi:Family of unknown function (DUF5681)